MTNKHPRPRKARGVEEAVVTTGNFNAKKMNAECITVKLAKDN